MDPFEEVKKYKSLLDQGVINQEEFEILKQKTLGLQTKEDNAKALEEAGREAKAELARIREEKRITEEKRLQEEKLAKQQEEERKISEELQQKKTETEAYLEQKKQAYDQIYNEEKAKEQARIDTQNKIAEEKAKEKDAKHALGNVVSWFFTAFLAIVGVTSIAINYTLSGIVLFVIIIVICPPISNAIKSKVPIYAKIKPVIIILLVILWFVTLSTVG